MGRARVILNVGGQQIIHYIEPASDSVPITVSVDDGVSQISSAFLYIHISHDKQGRLGFTVK